MPRTRAENDLFLHAALEYHRHGWAVIPLYSVHDGICACDDGACTHPGKHPLQSWKQYQSQRPSKAEIRAWWKDHAEANVGIVTGLTSGLVVLDVDPRNGGEATLETLLGRYGPSPATIEACTGGGGRHIFFSHPGTAKITSKAGALGRGLDIKADGGYIVAPPSRHAKGKSYEWAPGRGPEDVDVAPLPSWLLSHLDVAPAPSQRFKLPAVIEEGQRNDTLFRYARHLKSRGLEREAIVARLGTANQKRCTPPLPPNEIAEIEAKAHSQPDRVDFQARANESTHDSLAATGEGDDLPTIIVNDGEFRDVVDLALDALRAGNDPPSLFQRGGLLTRVRIDEQHTPSLEPLSPPALHHMLARVANWRRFVRNGMVPTPPPNNVVQDILALAAWEGIPPLRGLIECPIFAQEGTLLTDAGYHKAARLWLHRVADFTVPPINTRPSAAGLQEARDLILSELLGEFPFDSEASRANAVAAMLLPFLREMIAGPTPLHLIDAPAPGTGKGLLADVVSIPATGRGAEVMAEGQDDEEWRKRITAVLLKGPTFIMLDNVARRLDSAALAAALTGTNWKDRILGKTEVVAIPNRAVWLATGNNIIASNEIARRSLWIRIDSRTDRPWQRTDFRHPMLREWAHENRSKIVHACLTLVQAWIAAGKPAGDAMLGSFEAWAKTLGGILKVAGVDGFLGNADQFYTQADAENQEWRAFVLKWWDTHEDDKVGASDLYEIAEELSHQDGLLLDVLGDGTDRSKETRFGKALGRLRDRIFANYRIVDEGEDHRGRRRYRLQPIAQHKDTADVKPTSGRRSRPTSARKTADSILD